MPVTAITKPVKNASQGASATIGSMWKASLETLTGARSDETRQTVLSFLALLFLLLSYYLVKPLRDSRFLMHFDTSWLPYFFLVTPVLAFVVTKFFNHFVGRVPRRKLLLCTFGIMMACKLAFLMVLPITGRWVTALFYLWASVYFTLAISILWGVINSIFASEQAERCFGFVALGATIGNILGGQLSAWLSQTVLKDYALLFSIGGMGVALSLILAANPAETVTPVTSDSEIDPASPGSDVTVPEIPSPAKRGLEDVAAVFQNRYVRGIAMMVFTLALIGTVFNLRIYEQLDHTLSQRVYSQVFADLDPSSSHYEQVFGLKKLSLAGQKESQQQLFASLQWREPQITAFNQAYLSYQKKLEADTRKVFSDVSTAQGLLGVFLLVVVSRYLFKFVGLALTVMLLPVFYFVAGGALFFPLELLGLQVIMIVGNAFNYSLNNATKELLYTPTSESVRFQLKPLIEGPLMRLGDVSASLLKIGMAALASLVMISEAQQQNLMLGFGLLMVVLWMILIWKTGKQYDANQKLVKPQKELDLHA